MTTLCTFTVEDSTLLLLRKLQQIPLLSEMRLVGGTALALQLGHRSSVDLDFFGRMNFSKEELEYTLRQFGLKTSVKSESATIQIAQIEGVKVDFVDYSSVIWLEKPIEIDGFCLAGLQDIGAMKISAITGRGTKKDFIDLFFLLQHFSLEQLLTFYKHKFDTESIFHIVRSLTYFDDAEENPTPEMYQLFDWNDAKKTIREAASSL